jgi:hypothetical protein
MAVKVLPTVAVGHTNHEAKDKSHRRNEPQWRAALVAARALLLSDARRSNVRLRPEHAQLLKHAVELIEIARLLDISISAEPVGFLDLYSSHHARTHHNWNPTQHLAFPNSLQDSQSGVAGHGMIEDHDGGWASEPVRKFTLPKKAAESGGAVLDSNYFILRAGLFKNALDEK